jgi:hypothetical protein
MSAPLSQEQMIVHFLNRTSFGPTLGNIQSAARIGIRAYLDDQLAPGRIADHLAEEKVVGLKTMRFDSRELIELYPPPRVQRQLANSQADMAMQSMEGPRVVILELQQAKLLRALYSKRQLYEVMVDFWSNHFNIYAAKGANRWLTTAYDRDTIRPLALGKFKDLLVATAKSPAMLFYLDNWMSASPDSPGAQMGRAEQSAPGLERELRPRADGAPYPGRRRRLHTEGRPGSRPLFHRLDDCPAAAAQGVSFRPRIHDNGEKTVLGQRIREAAAWTMAARHRDPGQTSVDGAVYRREVGAICRTNDRRRRSSTSRRSVSPERRRYPDGLARHCRHPGVLARKIFEPRSRILSSSSPARCGSPAARRR